MLAELGAVGLSWGLEPAWDTLLWALSALLTVGTGALILSRHPRHGIGWLLCVLGLVNALTGDLPPVSFDAQAMPSGRTIRQYP